MICKKYAGEQFDFEVYFEVLYHVGGGRLKYSQLTGRIQDVTMASDSHQQAQLPQLQTR
jgi:hypothetical protein